MKHHFLQDLMSSITDRGRRLLDKALSSGNGNDPWPVVDSLLSGKGEASGVALAQRLIEIFNGLDDPARQAFFERLASDYGPDHERVRDAIKIYSKKRK